MPPMYADSGDQYKPSPDHYPAVQHLDAKSYVSQPGTVDLSRRQVIDHPKDPKNPDPREYGSEYSARDQLPDGRWMSYPTIYDGKAHPREEAFEHAQQSGQHMGIYDADTPPHVLNEVETALHSRPQKVNGNPLNGDSYAAMKAKQPGETNKTQGMFRQRTGGWKIDPKDEVEGHLK
jgi:hypothetical protein